LSSIFKQKSNKIANTFFIPGKNQARLSILFLHTKQQSSKTPVANEHSIKTKTRVLTLKSLRLRKSSKSCSSLSHHPYNFIARHTYCGQKLLDLVTWIEMKKLNWIEFQIPLYTFVSLNSKLKRWSQNKFSLLNLDLVEWLSHQIIINIEMSVIMFLWLMIKSVNKDYKHKTSSEWGQMIHWRFISARTLFVKVYLDHPSTANWKKTF
jgi:hypothetical protein